MAVVVPMAMMTVTVAMMTVAMMTVTVAMMTVTVAAVTVAAVTVAAVTVAAVTVATVTVTTVTVAAVTVTTVTVTTVTVTICSRSSGRGEREGHRRRKSREQKFHDDFWIVWFSFGRLCSGIDAAITFDGTPLGIFSHSIFFLNDIGLP